MSLLALFVIVAAAGLIALVLSGKAGVAQETTVRLSQIPSVFEQLKSTGSDASFAVIIPSASRTETDEALNIQFSIENDRIGLDWVLLSPVNIRDKEKFEACARRNGFRVDEVEMNDVRYLRTEERGADRLCQIVLKELYGLTDEDTLDLIVESFEWPPGSPTTPR